MEDENGLEWVACEDCDGDGQIENNTYDPDHDCRYGYDCECSDAEKFFVCDSCDGDGWVEVE